MKKSKTGNTKKTALPGAADIAGRVGPEVAALKPGEVMFIWVPPENTVTSNIETLRQSLKLGYKCVYISLSRDIGELLRVFDYSGLDTTRITFIDGVAKLYLMPQIQASNIVYVSGPAAPKEILDAVAKTASQIAGEKKLVYIDSLNRILAFSSKEKVSAFIQGLADILRQLNAVGVGISVSIGELDLPLLAELKIPKKIVDLTKPEK
jgi:hypothetical protein